jgi:hypothetical protein
VPTLSLEAIQQRIAQQDSELQTLRRELATRRSRLQSLAERKQELKAKLRQIEAEMAAVAAGAQRPVAALLKPASQRPTSKPTAAPKPGQPTLAHLIVAVLRDAGRPLTVKELAKEVKRRGFQSSSANFRKLVGKNVYELVRKNILRRPRDQRGFLVVPGRDGKAAAKGPGAPNAKRGVMQAKAKPTPAAGPAKPVAKTTAAVNGAFRSASGPQAGQHVTLRVLLTQILQQQTKPLTGSALAEAALKAGYQTSSKRFVDSVWTALGNMKNVENVKGQGYRLKKARA